MVWQRWSDLARAELHALPVTMTSTIYARRRDGEIQVIPYLQGFRICLKTGGTSGFNIDFGD